MQLSSYLAVLAAVLPVVYGAPAPLADSLHPEILAAMKRDLGLDEVQATRRVARELWAANTIEQIQTTTGDAFAGAWIAEDGNTLTVGITDAAAAADVVAVGAVPVIVATSLARLQAAKDALDARDTSANTSSLTTLEAPATGIAAYWVDIVANKIVFEALAASTAEAEALAAQVGLEASEFEVRTVEVMPTTLATVQGGIAYLINASARCSVGFSVTTGFVSAGHCGSVGSSATTSSGASLGTFSGKVFPGSADMSYIKTVSGTTLSGVVYAYGGTNIAVKGSTVSAVGSSICRSGSTTGVHCGTVGALGVTVTYSQGSVTGLTRTSVCAEPGDSGGSFYTGGQAQGVTSGGSGDCTSGGTTYFQPVNEILSTYGLTLVTS